MKASFAHERIYLNYRTLLLRIFVALADIANNTEANFLDNQLNSWKMFDDTSNSSDSVDDKIYTLPKYKAVLKTITEELDYFEANYGKEGLQFKDVIY